MQVLNIVAFIVAMTLEKVGNKLDWIAMRFG